MFPVRIYLVLISNVSSRRVSYTGFTHTCSWHKSHLHLSLIMFIYICSLHMLHLHVSLKQVYLNVSLTHVLCTRSLTYVLSERVHYTRCIYISIFKNSINMCPLQRLNDCPFHTFYLHLFLTYIQHIYHLSVCFLMLIPNVILHVSLFFEIVFSIETVLLADHLFTIT